MSSWSPPMVMFACHRAVRLGSPPVTSCRVDRPASERSTSTIWCTSSCTYSASSHSCGNTSMPSWKWLVTSSESGSTVYQHGVQ